MKWAIPILLVAALVAGCKDEDKNPVLKYGNAVVKAIDVSKSAVSATNLQSVKSAILTYYTMNDKYPASMDVLAKIMGYKFRPEQYNYDPSTGEISAK
jgi:type IV secretory pathway component VirB8